MIKTDLNWSASKQVGWINKVSLPKYLGMRQPSRCIPEEETLKSKLAVVLVNDFLSSLTRKF